jgi:hypothetical protein
VSHVDLTVGVKALLRWGRVPEGGGGPAAWSLLHLRPPSLLMARLC